MGLTGLQIPETDLQFGPFKVEHPEVSMSKNNNIAFGYVSDPYWGTLIRVLALIIPNYNIAIQCVSAKNMC